MKCSPFRFMVLTALLIATRDALAASDTDGTGMGMGRGGGSMADTGWSMWGGGWHGWLPVSMIVVLVLLVLASLVLVYLFTRPVSPQQLERLGSPPPDFRDPEPIRDRETSSQSEERDTYMVIPDISGYTKYISLNQFAAGHAQHVVSQLLDTIIEAAEPPLTATRIEGDAVVFYAVSAQNGSGTGVAGTDLMQATVELLSAFYRKRAELRLGNGCRCSTCRKIDDLDIKVIIHRGSIMHYRLKGLEDLSGVAVIVAHRLLKNSLGMNRYVLVTEEASQDMNLPFERTHSGHRESYDGVGDIACNVYTFDPKALAPEDDVERRNQMAAKTLDIFGKLGKNARTLRRPAGSSLR